jgi:hypothetical protein
MTTYIVIGAAVGVLLLFFFVITIDVKRKTKGKILTEIIRRDSKSENRLSPITPDGRFVVVKDKKELKRYVIPTSEQGGTLFTNYPIGGFSLIQTVVPKLIFVEDNTESLQIAKNVLGLEYSGASASVLGNAYKPYAFQEFVNAVERSEGGKRGTNLTIITLVLLLIITLGTAASVYYNFKNADALSTIGMDLKVYAQMVK